MMCTSYTVSFGKGGHINPSALDACFFRLRQGTDFSCLQLDLKAGRLIQHCFEPEKHIHETLCGLRVRSESEILIINSPYDYGIPVDYERIPVD